MRGVVVVFFPLAVVCLDGERCYARAPTHFIKRKIRKRRKINFRDECLMVVHTINNEIHRLLTNYLPFFLNEA